jgi:hypothetical protein
VDAHNGDVEAQNGVIDWSQMALKEEQKPKKLNTLRNRIRIKVKRSIQIRIRIYVMWISVPVPF